MSASTPARPRTILAICLATGFTTLVDQSILTVAVPALRTDLAASGSDVQWILAIYSLTFGLVLVPAGRLGDAWGRGRLLVGGLTLFSAASVLGAAATAPWVLIVARLVQGIGAGTANPQVIGLMQDHFTGPARARALGAYAAVASLSGMVAPVVGGLLLAVSGPDVGWRLVMAVNLPFGIVTCVVAARRLRLGRVARGARAELDPVGIGLLSVITLAVLLPVVGGAAAAPWIAAGVVAVPVLAWWERRLARRGGAPVLHPALVRSPGFVLGTVVAMCWFGSSLGTGVVVTLALQEGLGLSPLLAGLCLVPSALAMGVTSTIGWRVVGRWGRASVTTALGVLAGVLACTVVAVAVLPPAALVSVLVVSQFLTGAAGGLIASPNQGLTLALAPPGAHGLAAGFFQVSQRVSSTVCIAACTGVFVASAGPDGYRTGLATALGIALVLTVVALVASASDRHPSSTPEHRVACRPARP
ncbi:MFS transporter [Pseudonocardia endophytica]|uniref:MFS transporter n=1 Tax=Pseudonocardia endophytica TaxID=401976 RepID=A0A4R1HNF7_PSEEN|nr:MFS transporter [Pseudonocardia endophytica]TCK22135.1 MFS transporter [Pseudonocardia endophytica]